MCQHATPDEVLRTFVPGKKQYIGQLELLYAVAPYYTLPHVFADRDVIHFIDNTSACWALVKGYSRAIDSGMIVSAFHASMVSVKARVFFEYVDTKANPADLPSRGAMTELVGELSSAGIGGNIVTVEYVLPKTQSWWSSAGHWISGMSRKVKDAIRVARKAMKRKRT